MQKEYSTTSIVNPVDYSGGSSVTDYIVQCNPPLLQPEQPGTAQFSSFEWKRELQCGTFLHKFTTDRTRVDLEDVKPLVIRTVCHVLLDEIPDKGLHEVWESLSNAREFYAQVPAAPAQLRSAEHGRAAASGTRHTRPVFSLPVE